MSARTCADCGHRLDIHTPDGCVALHLDGSLCACHTPTPERPEGETMKHHTLGYLNPTGLFGPNATPQGCSSTPPARERGEAMLAELRRKLLEEPTWPEDVPEVSGAECPDCGWPRVQAQREGYPLKAEVARLTRELAEARALCNGSCDIALARRQVGPDGLVPGNARECAEAWEREATRLRAALRAERERVVRWCWENLPVPPFYDHEDYYNPGETAEDYLARALAALDPEATR